MNIAFSRKRQSSYERAAAHADVRSCHQMSVLKKFQAGVYELRCLVMDTPSKGSSDPISIPILRSRTTRVRRNVTYQIDLLVVAREGRPVCGFGKRVVPKSSVLAQAAQSPSRARVQGSRKSASPICKKELVRRIVSRSTGATLAEIRALTGWQAHSIRSCLSTIAKNNQIRIQSFTIS